MSGEQYLTASQIILITKGLKIAVLQVMKTLTSEEVKEVATKVLDGISARFPNLERSKSIVLCTFLDPRFKHHLFEDRQTLDFIKPYVIELVTGLINKEMKTTEPTTPVETVISTNLENYQTSEPKRKKISIWDDYETIICKVRPTGTPTSQAIVEVQRYIDDAPIRRNEDPLKWWLQHKYIYPNLATIVRSKCNMVATSVPSERMFSKAGNLINERRTRLTSKKVKELMFLNANIK